MEMIKTNNISVLDSLVVVHNGLTWSDIVVA